jgi:hypothetical protein
MRWLACPLAVITFVLPSAASAPTETPSAIRSQCSLSNSDGIEQELRFIHEEQSVAAVDSDERSIQ